MATRITVNGVGYDSVEAMPAEVRRVYEQALARMPELAARTGGAVRETIEGGGSGLESRTVVRQKFIVNGNEYESLDAMPADVREQYQLAMRKLGDGGVTVKKNEIKLSFQVTGPGFRFGRNAGSGSPAESAGASPRAELTARTQGLLSPAPIEPDSQGGGRRMALYFFVFGALGLALWLLMRAR